MTKYKPRCSYLGCDPVESQCLGFCENKEMPVQFAEPEPVERHPALTSAGRIDFRYVAAVAVIFGLAMIFVAFA